MDRTISASIDRATQQREAAPPEQWHIWDDILRGLEVTIDHDARLDAIEERMAELWAYHECEGRPVWACPVDAHV